MENNLTNNHTEFKSESVLQQVTADPVIASYLERLDETQHYHTFEKGPAQHVKRSLDGVQELATKAGLDEHKIELMKVAVLLHDITYSINPLGHELESAQFAVEHLRRLGVPFNEVMFVAKLIHATAGEYKNGTYVTHPQTTEERIMCDADMCAIALDPEEFLLISEQIRLELNERNRARNAPEISQQDWYKSQYAFVKNYQWNSEVPDTWEQNRLKNIEALEKLAHFTPQQIASIVEQNA